MARAAHPAYPNTNMTKCHDHLDRVIRQTEVMYRLDTDDDSAKYLRLRIDAVRAKVELCSVGVWPRDTESAGDDVKAELDLD